MVSTATTARFDYAAFRQAFSRKDVGAWAEFYADDAEWIEYRHNAPPRAPHRMVGKQQIADFLRAVAAENIAIELSDEVLSGDLAAFRVTGTFPDGRRIIEHVIVELRAGKITRQVDVEAWD